MILYTARMGKLSKGRGSAMAMYVVWISSMVIYMLQLVILGLNPTAPMPQREPSACAPREVIVPAATAADRLYTYAYTVSPRYNGRPKFRSFLSVITRVRYRN